MTGRIIITFILSFFSISFLEAQVAQEDSLKAVIRNSKVPGEIIPAYTILANMYASKNFDESMKMAEAGREVAKKIKDSVGMAEFTRIIGLNLYFKGKFNDAASYYYESLKMLESNTSKNGKHTKALTLNELGKLFRKTRDLDRALQHYSEALDIYKELNDEEGMATIFNESGVVYEYKADYAEALNRYNRSLEIRNKMGDKLGESYSLSFIGGIYALQKDFGKARKYLDASLDLRRQLKDSFSMSLSYSDIAIMYMEMNDYPAAIDYYTRSNTIADSMKYPQLMLENYKSMALAEEKRKDPGRSLEYFKKYAVLKDSIMTTEKINQIESLHAQYQAEKKEHQLALQQAVIQRKNTMIWGMVAVSLLLFYAGLNAYRKKQAQNRLLLQETVIKEQEAATRAVLEAEDNERKRIAAELHDGIGQMMSAAKMNLSVFENELTFENNKQKKQFENVISLVDMSCKEIRSVSHQMMPKALMKNGLVNAVREFVDRIDNRVIKISLHTEGLKETIDINTASVLYRVIQESVNNVLKHADAGRLDISIAKDDEGIDVTIEDDGKGFKMSDSLLQDGIGLKNIVSRVQFLKGTVEFDTSPGKGTLVAIHIPKT